MCVCAVYVRMCVRVVCILLHCYLHVLVRSEMGQLNQRIMEDPCFGNPYVLAHMYTAYSADEVS